MIKYTLKRLLMLIPVIIGITLFIFIIMSFAPGDPARMKLGNDASPQQLAEMRHELGLDQPLLVRYVDYLGKAVQGDLGTSWYSDYNVASEFLSRLPNTLTLGLLAMLLSILVAYPIGILAAVKQFSVYDYGTLVFAMLFASMPAFWLGLIAQIYLSIHLGLFPATGVGSLAHFILPAITLAGVQVAGEVRGGRTLMLELLKQDFVRTARSKGASEKRVIIGHAFRNALLPSVTGLGMQFATLLGGAVVTESVFAIPGVGSLLINAVRARDVPVVMGIIFVIAIFVGVVNLLTDLLYVVVDPRVKRGYVS